MEKEEDGPLTAGKAAKLGQGFSLNIPVDLLGRTGWAWQSGPVLTASLLEEGRVRLRLASELRHMVEALRAEIQRSGASDRDEKLAVLADKYRDVKLYASNNHRVQLDRTIAVYLGLVDKDDRTVFIESKKGSIDIMSLAYRNKRQAEYFEELEIPEA